MAEEKKKKQKAKTGFLPILCSGLGTAILLLVIAIFIPLTVPRLFGYEIYHVVSGSMAPAIPTGSAVFVQPCSPESVQTQEVIAFDSGGSVVTHRVVKNRIVEGDFVTKGDANAIEDIESVPYRALIGRVKYHVPFLGTAMALVASPIGKLYLLLFACCGVMFNLLGDRIRYNRSHESADS